MAKLPRAGLTSFGRYLADQKISYDQVAKAVDVTNSYVSMLARGKATPGFKLALAIAHWTEKKFPKSFVCEDWD